jgi:hypothetical protein
MTDQTSFRYYAGGSRLRELVTDPSADINEVVREAERLCNREFHAAEYYRKHPELLYPAHPWMKFVATGEAAYLGWDAEGIERRPGRD